MFICAVSNGVNAIQVWVDTFTKMIHAEPTTMQLTSEGVTWLTRDGVIWYHGVPSEKFSDWRLGPYEILEKVGAASYKLKVPGLDFKYPVYSESIVTPYNELPPHRRKEHPDPKTIGGHKEYQVEEILKHRKFGRGYQYLIKWKNYPLRERTWEPSRHLTHAKHLLNEYNKKHHMQFGLFQFSE
jgi:hypothetical protein